MKKYHILIVALLAFAGQAVAQNISYNGSKLTRYGQDVNVKTNIDITNLNVKSTQMLIVTPTIVSEDGQNEKALGAIALCGNNRYRALGREIKLKNAKPEAYALTRIKLKDAIREGTPINFEQTIAYEPWMANSKLLVREYLTGCADCNKGTNRTPLVGLFDPINAPYTLAYTAPTDEGVKHRSSSFDAMINFNVDRSDILINYKNNKNELDRVDDFIKSLQADKRLTVTEMYITGYASPEASVEYNQLLSERRANSLATFLQEAHKDELPKLTTKGAGEDWETLRRLVAESNLADRDAILNIIDADHPDLDVKNDALKALGANVYRSLLYEYYPASRRNTVRVDYIAKEFTLEEAREMIHSEPHLLSEHEIYRVAMSYPEESNERYEAFEVALDCYPMSAISRINLACASLEKDDVRNAISLLEPISSKEGVQNVLGVAYARNGQLDDAKKCFETAARQGYASAKKNLDLLLNE